MPNSLQHPTGSGSTTPSRFSTTEPRSGFTSEQIAEWRIYINRCQHPVVVIDGNFRPILLNEPLRVRLSDPSTAEGMEQPTAFVWQTVCETTARIVSEAARTTSDNFAEAFPIQRRCFVATGSLFRSSSGQVIGAIVHLGDLVNSQDKLRSALAGSTSPSEAPSESAETSDEQNEEFRLWNSQREQARRRMAKLSRRETQVVSLVSDGLPNKSIAHVLDISVKTIEKHRANATRKLGVGSTAEMVRIAVIADGKSPVVADHSNEQTNPGFAPTRQ